MVYLHFGFKIPTGQNILSRTGTTLGAAHVAGSLNQIGRDWLPVATQGEYRFEDLTAQQVFKKSPAGELMRLCYKQISEVVAPAELAEEIFAALDGGSTPDFDSVDIDDSGLSGSVLEQTAMLLSELRDGGTK
jgi:hypothetical protein